MFKRERYEKVKIEANFTQFMKEGYSLWDFLNELKQKLDVSVKRENVSLPRVYLSSNFAQFFEGDNISFEALFVNCSM